jgi:radical S-adenosyl methionine domain-containing protein 2
MLTTINPASRQLVVNWHMTEACNYSCSYCYAHWNKTTQTRDLMRDASLTKSLLDELFSFFSDNPANPLRAEMRWDSVRLNLAGGEPLLNPRRTLEVVSMAKQVGFEVSMITNGSRLDAPTLNALAPNLAVLGISLDSSDDITNKKIGRMDRYGHLLSQSNS